MSASATGGDVLFAASEEGIFLDHAIVPFDVTAGELQGELERIDPGRRLSVVEGSHDTSSFHSWVVTFVHQGGVALLVASGEDAGFFGGEALSCEVGVVECTGLASVAETTVGAGSGRKVVVQVANIGDVGVSGGVHSVSIGDVLPAGVEAVSMEGAQGVSLEAPGGGSTPVECSVKTVSCRFVGVVPAFSLIEIDISVVVRPGAGGVNRVSVSGGEGFLCSSDPGAGKFRNSVCTEEVNGERVANGEEPAGGFELVLTGLVHGLVLERPVRVSGEATGFGVEVYEARPEEDGGGLDTQAGSHPYQVTFSGFLNENGSGEPAQLPKDILSLLPPGFIGNPSAIKTCPLGQFFSNGCPADTVLGAAMITIHEPAQFANASLDEVGTFTLPIVNLEAQHGEAARFGFNLSNIAPAFIDAHVRTGEDYGVTASSTNITQLTGVIGFRLTFWGVPGNPGHNVARELTAFGGPLAENEPPPFLALPTQCQTPLRTSLLADSWVDPVLREYPGQPMGMLDGCNHLAFAPSIKVAPDVEEASKPTGLNVDVHVDQSSVLDGTGLAESNVRGIKVTLPNEVAVNPSSGNGLEACSEGLVGFRGSQEFPLEPGEHALAFTPRLPGSIPAREAGEEESFSPGVNFCANASKIATVKIKSPLLPQGQFVEGGVYLASQNSNPFGSLLAMYIVAEDPVSGTVVKLPGQVALSETGQLTTTFENNPQLAFEDAELHFFGGERAPLANPAHCGTFETKGQFTPWSGGQTVEAKTVFQITSGPNHTPCPGSTLPFGPLLTGGTTNINAGAFSPLTTTVAREDGQQDMQSVTLHMPEGLSGILTGIPLCPETQANEGTCPAASLIGETTVEAGVGGDPVSVKGGKVYLTEKYAGAPFGLSIVNPVKAGPFDLEHDTSNAAQQPACDCIVVRAKIQVDPYTAALTVSTDSSGPHAIPHLIDGIPVNIQKVNVTITREHFTFNPTNCAPTQITGTITSSENTSQSITVPFQATNCATLAFHPTFTVTTSGKTSKTNGASLTAKITYPPTPPGNQATAYAAIAKVKVDLPKALPSRLTTLQKACLAIIFETNPANCPPQSIVGHAKVITPLLPEPLQGPAYFVSHGNEAFPSLTMVLQGYGITIDLIGSTYIHNGITSTTFHQTPDAPLTSFQLTLPQGPNSALAANGNLCTTKLNMPTAFTAQNGQQIHQTTPIHTTNCTTHHTKHKHKTKHNKKHKK